MKLIKAGEIKVIKPKKSVLLKRLREDFAIAEGEASVLLLAHQRQAILAIDFLGKLGIQSPLEYEDYLQGLDLLKRL